MARTRYPAGYIVSMLLAAGSAHAAQQLEQIQSEVIQADGTQAEIATRARACATQVLRNDSIVIRDSARVGPLSAPGDTSGDTSTLAGGQVVTTFDAAAGLVVAQSRVTIAKMLGAETIQSTVTVETKDGRFRVTHSAIARAFADTGYGTNRGLEPVYIGGMTGHAKVEQALRQTTEKLAACVRTAAKSDW